MGTARRRVRFGLVAVVLGLATAHLQAVSADAAAPVGVSLEAESGLVGGHLAVTDGPPASGGRFVAFPGPAGPPPPSGVRVAGNRLLRDGRPFVPVGFTLVAVAHPTAGGGTAWAAGHLDDATMQEAIGWGANTIRYQVSQRGLDPTDPLYSDAYVQRVVDAVALARGHGLVVLISVQDQRPAGGTSHAQPTEATIRDWQTLTARFNGDQNVIYELYNEPHNRATPAGWAVWRDGGPPAQNQGSPAVGHQRVLDAIRATGSANVVIADAAQYGQLLAGIPPLHDPLGQVAYGVHPYLTNWLRNPSDWEPGFGFLASQFPVVATEWMADSGAGFCHPEWGQTAPQLVDFLQNHGIGLLAWAFDVHDSVVSDGRYTPTNLDGFQCGDLNFGAGALLQARMPGWGPELSGCETGLSDQGVLALPVDVPTDGTYRLWSRAMPPPGGGGVPLLQVDDRCPVPAWSAPGPPGQWSWQTAVAGVALTAGRHTLRFLGAPGGMNLDRVVLTTEPGCVPDAVYPLAPCPTSSTSTSVSTSPSPASSGSPSTTPRA